MASRSRFSFGVTGQVLSLFGLSALLLITAASFGYREMSESLRMFDEEVAVSQRKAINIEATEINFKKQVQEWKDVLIRGKKPELLDKHWTAFTQRETDVRDLATKVGGGLADPEAARLVKDFIAAHKEMGEAYRKGLQAFKDHGFDSAAGDQAVAGIDRNPSELLTRAKERLVAEAEREASAARDAAQRASSISIILFSLLTLASVAAFFIATLLRVSRPLTATVSALNQLADGNFSVTLPGLQRGDEIGAIARSVERFKVKAEEKAREEAELKIKQDQADARQRQALLNRMADDFEKAVGQIVETVSSASTELEASAKGLSRTAASTQKLSNVVSQASEEASTNVQAVASATEELSSSIREISRQVQASARIAHEAVDQARGTTDRVGELSRTATSIGDVIELINSIAGQTNLLALNATIEAARAGEAGRGFAVVASEVKALAEQTSKATGEIGQQITSIQSATGVSVTAIKEISGTIERLSEIASTIAAAVEEQGAATQEISRNIQQAAEGTQQVTSNVSEVQRGTNDTGSASEVVLSAAGALSSESNKLKLEMNRFLATIRAA
jgi:methyl-accepting chemotaxis protein